MIWRPRASSMRGALGHLDQRLRPAPRSTGTMRPLIEQPAEERDPLQFALEDEERIVEQRQQREGFPGRLMLGRDHAARPFGIFSAPRNSTLMPQIDAQQQEIDCGPSSWRPR